MAYGFLAGALLLVGAPLCGGCLIRNAGGAFSKPPDQLPALSAAAQALIENAYTGVQRDRLVDYHVHVVGLGSGGTGAWVNPAMQSYASPVRRLRYSVYLSAAGIDDAEHADQQYVQRLVELARHQPSLARYHLLAFDHHYRHDGTMNEAKSEFYVPNAYVFQLAADHPDLFAPVMSVHPYRPDALAELEHWAQAGGKLIKWLPNAMGIDPADRAIDPYYDKVRTLGLVILSHGGEEKAVEAEDDQRLGNPLLWRRALDRGVKVIMAHCASFGEHVDLEHPDRPIVPSLDLFFRLMDEPRYQGLLFGEISAVTLFNRIGDPLTRLLRRTDLHIRYVNGSDYPLPAVNFLVRTGELADAGYISASERAALNEIYDVNPLLFDFVLKRTVRAPETGEQFAASVFAAKPPL